MSTMSICNFAPVARIMKTALPENAKIAKEAKECMQECVSEFISFITSEGSSGCEAQDNRFPPLTTLPSHSVREMSSREAQDCQRGRHPVRHDFIGV